MARQKGSAQFSGTLEPLAGGPLDARTIVPTKADLTVAANFPYKYVGMMVSVQDEGIAYMLIGADTTLSSNWKAIGSDVGQTIQVDTLPTASADNVGKIYQYVGLTLGASINGYFYKVVEDSTVVPSVYSWERIDVQPQGAEKIIEGYFNSTNSLFYEDGAYTKPVTGASNTLYIDVSRDKSYRYNGTVFVRVDKEENIQVSVMPSAISTLDGKIVQYVGATTADYTNAYFYKCIEDPDNAGTYIWAETAVFDAIPSSEKGAANGVAELDANGLVPSTQLPSYVDDVIEGYYDSTTDKFYEEDTHTTEIDPETGKIYVDLTDDPHVSTYRWSGSAYYKITDEDLKTQFTTMPTASVDNVGKIVQYVGTTTADYTSGYFYICEEDSENPGTYIWTAKEVQENTGGGDATITEDITANIEVGGITSGTLISEGTTITELAKKMLVKEMAPTTAFTASGSGVKEVGTSVTPTLTLTISSTGTGTPVSIEFYSGSTLLDTQAYVAGTNAYTLTMSTAVTTNTTVKGVLNYKKSDNTNATVEKSATYTFVMASYSGAVATAPTTAAEITALTKNVKNTKALTTTFNLSNQRSCYAYPASFGNLTSIKDANNFEYIGSYTLTSVTVDGTAYNVYTLTDPVTASGFKQIYA